MKKFKRSLLGVTLLEIMLVLAIAAMIIVMSVRYYQAASSSQQAKALLSLIQAVTAAGDSLAQGSARYGAVTNTSVANLINGGKPLLTPWGSPVEIFNPWTNSYDINYRDVPLAVCTAVIQQLTANPRYKNISPAICANTNTLSYQYDASK